MNLDDRLARLSPQRRALLARRLEQLAPSGAPVSQIPSQPRDGRRFPLSFAQERLYFEHQLAPGDSSYNEAVVLRVRGRLDVDWIEQSLADLVRRHESLRTAIVDTAEGPRQAIADDCRVPVERRALDGSDPAVIHAAVAAEIRRPFDLAQPPLLRMSALRVAPNDHVLVLVVHHIVLDGWSAAAVFRDIFADYRSRQGTQQPVQVPVPVPVHYVDFAAWERQRLEGGALDGELAFWSRVLADAPPPPFLPFDRPRAAVRSSAGGRVAFRCEGALSAALRDLAQRRETTVFAVLAAAYGLLLARFGGEPEVVLAVPTTVRDLPELESAVGLFINTLVLRLPVPRDATFEAYLTDVQARAMAVQAHRLYPHDRLIAELRQQRDMGPVPWTALMFDVQRLPVGIAPEGLSIDYLDVDPGTCKFDLGLSFKDDGEALTGTFEYASDLFDRATIEAMARALLALLADAVARPQANVCELALLSGADHDRQLAASRGPIRDYALDATVGAAFEAVAAERPDALAVISGDRTASFHELSVASNRLAHRLIGLGVEPGAPVAVTGERSLELIVAILGVLKAGAFYVPLDTAWPFERQAEIVADIGARVVVSGIAAPWPQGVIVCEPAAAGGEPDTGPSVRVTADDLAYAIYTSGSTGRPRGVAVRHASVMNLFGALGDAVYGGLPGRQLRIGLNGPTAFDTSVKQIIQLLAGHALDVVPAEARADPTALVRYVQRHAIDVLDVTPTHLRMLLDAGLDEAAGPVPLAVLVGGEAIDEALWRRLARSSSTLFFNLYGPTECTVDTTVAAIGDGAPTIGLPLANTQALVLDDIGRPVPIGAIGELYIGGAGVARGYTGDERLTRERFLTLPFDPEPVYRTGDRVRRRHDGALVFHGRSDDQVKLRGYRIEPGEIAAALERCDGVRDAAVVLQGEGAHQRLVAYAVVDAARAPLVAGRPRRELPNGLAVVELNRNETDFLYEEMFERNAYLRHGLALSAGDVVFDVGANIGLFSLSAHVAAPGLKLHAFEPNPEVYALLDANLHLYGADAVAHPIGLGAATGAGEFSFYPGFSILSGLHADGNAEAAVVRSFVRKHERDERAYDGEGLDELIGERLRVRTFAVELDTLSAVMARSGVERIDLLKINVEKAELEVLAGIDDADWPRIRQVALEVHDIDGRLAQVQALLQRHGFTVAVDRDWRLEDEAGTNFYVYAHRGERKSPPPPTASALVPMLTPERLREALRRQLPDYMLPSDVVMLDALPMTTNGKLDRSRLPDPQSESAAASRAPATETERRVAAIWCEVLKRDAIGADDDFFRIGGHSLLATLLVAELRNSLGVHLPLRTLFEAPTVARLASRIDAAEGGSGRPGTEASLPLVEPDPASWHEPFPLTPIQEAYWMGRNAAFELGDAATQIYLELEQPGWDLGRIEAVWNRLVKRHDMLRAVILSEQRQQVLAEVPHYAIEADDLRGLPGPVVKERLEAKRCAMTGQSLSLDRWPLFCVKASLLDGGVVRLHVAVDALIADAASLFLLFDEWKRGYETNETPPPLAIGFRDYVLAERELAGGELHRASRDYWFDRLDTLPPAPDLPVDRGLAAQSRPAFTRRSRRLDAARWSALKARAANAGLTPSLVLIAAYAEILARWSGSARFTLNLTTFNRLPLHADVAGLMGDFTTLTLLEVAPSAATPFTDRARALQARLWDDLEHRYISGIEVLRGLAQRRRSGATALMPVVFTSALDIDPAGQKAQRFGEVIESVSQTPQVWLDHQVMEWNGSLVLNWDAVEGLFPAGFLDDMASAHGDLIERLATSDDSWAEPLGDLLPPAQAARRGAVNDTAEAFPALRLEQRFIEWARRSPAAPAIVTSGRELSYGELHARAAEIAGLLDARGQGPGCLVAIVMRKGWEQIAAVLGVLMAGAAYVPVDADLPQERQHYLLGHCDVAVALTQAEVGRVTTWPDGVTAIAVDGLAGSSGGPQSTAADGEALAYVLFTSGSTGVPKGVMIGHRAICNTICDFGRRYDLRPHDRTLALSALSFDLSLFDMFGPLSAGGAVVVPDADKLRDTSHMAELARRHGVTVWQSVPLLMQMLVEALEEQGVAGGQGWPATLRTVIMSGDWIPVSLPDRIRALAGPIAVHGQGGATETSINAVVYPIGEVDPAWRSIPYGKPFANQTAHVLDGELQAAPDWVPGELYIGGIGLADGYWKDPEKTAAAFVRHPRTGERLYRTGDYGRYLPDGNIEFLGRRDGQVKINGYRIELGEVEAVLRQHADVMDVVVTAPADTAGRRTLAAYLTRRSEEGPDVGAELSTAGVLLDPIERLTFKLGRRGLRETPAGAGAIPLPGAAFADERSATWLRRQSIRHFQPEPILLDRFAAWLGVLQPMPVVGSALPKMLYPSAGSLYPVQAYVAVKAGAVAGLAGGTYYYDPPGHRLVAVGAAADLSAHYPRANRGIVTTAAFTIVLVGKRSAVEPLYGPLWRDFCLLEAGYIGQLLAGAAADAGIGLCPLGFVDEATTLTAFGLDEGHAVLHSMAGGAIAADQLSSWSPEEAPQAGANAEAMRAWMGRKLPDYMVPSAFVFLDHLPRTANGKVDREALPKLGATVAADAGAPPRTELEKTIAAAVEAVLGEGGAGHQGPRGVGIDANFFDLGANSIHLVQMHRQLQSALDRSFPLVDIFQNPSIRRLSAFLDGQGAELDAADIRARVERARSERTKRLARRRSAADVNRSDIAS
ncbi:non-ribosomal peptide synthetase [Chelatococcus reniformis]|uniref:L-cysteine--[L-cysteinyl-carrier protein] ligase n=1 Tax=Chelatococcus reniformis TaxID=1494448 RepID=A0A916X6W9_9HYPH|nr:non-ribosomal peptide synthetase [Chelatococcus reniformis]GGC48553.1 hypothetical protein GCM10010994_04660 [Chelatococcus reniformis]